MDVSMINDLSDSICLVILIYSNYIRVVISNSASATIREHDVI